MVYRLARAGEEKIPTEGFFRVLLRMRFSRGSFLVRAIVVVALIRSSSVEVGRVLKIKASKRLFI
jgi:hypothetical protein